MYNTYPTYNHPLNTLRKAVLIVYIKRSKLDNNIFFVNKFILAFIKWNLFIDFNNYYLETLFPFDLFYKVFDINNNNYLFEI